MQLKFIPYCMTVIEIRLYQTTESTQAAIFLTLEGQQAMALTFDNDKCQPIRVCVTIRYN